MKKSATILLLALMVSIQTPLGQFLKLPILVEHFLKHRETEGISLFTFLEEHYSRGHDDADLPEDDRLPFRSITISTLTSAIVTPIFQTDDAFPVLTIDKMMAPDTYTPQLHFSRIFHPPRA